MKTIPLFLLLGCVVGVAVHAAQTSVVNGIPVPDMDERTLQEKYHITPNKEGLLGALRHERGEVRDFAALQLANDGHRDAIPSITVFAVFLGYAEQIVSVDLSVPGKTPEATGVPVHVRGGGC